MKKFLQLIALFALTSTGAWAEELNLSAGVKNNGTVTNTNGAVNQGLGYIYVSATTPQVTILATNASGENSNVINRGNGFFIASNISNFEISLPDGYLIQSFTYNIKNNDGSKTITFTSTSGTVSTATVPTTATDITVSDINAQSASFTLTATKNGSPDGWSPCTVNYIKIVYSITDYTNNVETNIKPWIESVDGGYFKLNSSNSAVASLLQAYNAHHTGDTWTEDEYNTLVSLLDAAKASEGAYLMPEAGYYLIKNTRYSKYVGFGTSSNSSKGNGLVLYSAICPATVLKLVKNGNKYTVSSQGLFGKQFPTNANDQLLPFTNVESDAKEFTFTPVDGNGNVAISTEPYTNPNNNNMTIGYWHGTSWDGVVSWTKDAEPSWFTVEDAIDKTFDITMNAVGGKNYATTYLPFPVVLSEAAAYTVKVNGKQAEYTLAGSEIPAGEAVLLMSNASTTLTATIQDVTTTVGENDLLGVYAKTAASDLTNPTVLNAVDEKIGFYKLAASSTLSANRAYLNYAVPEGAKEGFDLVDANETTGVESIDNAQFAIDNAPVYNLQGQRVVKAQKGVFIQNGKKMVVK